jgi:hypothetical protein
MFSAVHLRTDIDLLRAKIKKYAQFAERCAAVVFVVHILGAK